MAQEVKVILIDDVDGGPADETLTFALEGATYEIDLSDRNAAKLRADFQRWANAGRKTTARRRGGASSGASDAGKIREWARANGVAVPDRGRIPADVRAKYEAAN